jgi:ribosome biogenesis protein SSF1/2
VSEAEDPSKKGQPKSFVVRRGRHAAVLKDLEVDIRKLMSPNTASKLRESKRNVLKDFVHVAGPLGVTHLLMLSATHNAAYLRVAKSPRGPTLTLRIHEYALIRDVLSSQQRPRAPQSMWLGPPLVVMNNFNVPGGSKKDTEHLKLATVMFQNLFPTINVANTKLSSCQRVVLLEYNPETRRISLRHFSVSTQPTGVSKNLKTLLTRKQLPGMGRMTDVSEFLTRSGYGSESEGEDAEASRVEIEEGTAGGASGGGSSSKGPRQSRIRLSEVGPRLELEIIKVEEGLCGGKVLYHRYVKKTAAEAAAQETEAETKKREKEKRRKEQDANVQRKMAEKKRKDEESAAGGKKGAAAAYQKKRRKTEWWEEEGEEAKKQREEGNDDDAEWYEKEVGEAPDDEFKRMQSRGGGRGGGSRGRGGGGGRSRGGGRSHRGRGGRR